MTDHEHENGDDPNLHQIRDILNEADHEVQEDVPPPWSTRPAVPIPPGGSESTALNHAPEALAPPDEPPGAIEVPVALPLSPPALPPVAASLSAAADTPEEEPQMPEESEALQPPRAVSPLQEMAVQPGTRPVVEFLFHPHWVDPDAVRTVLEQLQPLVTVISGDHRLNAATRQFASRLGLRTTDHRRNVPTPDLVVLFADESDAKLAPPAPAGITELVCSHTGHRRAIRWSVRQ